MGRLHQPRPRKSTNFNISGVRFLVVYSCTFFTKIGSSHATAPPGPLDSIFNVSFVTPATFSAIGRQLSTLVRSSPLRNNSFPSPNTMIRTRRLGTRCAGTPTSAMKLSYFPSKSYEAALDGGWCRIAVFERVAPIRRTCSTDELATLLQLALS